MAWERAYSASARLSAPVEAVWAVLTDLEQYPSWNPFTVRVQSSLVVGARVVMRVRLGWLTIRQVEWVSDVAPPERLAWRMRTPARWLLRAERVQTLVRTAEGCEYHTVDTIGGLLEPVVGWLFGSALERGFAGVAAALEARLAELSAGPLDPGPAP